MGPNESGDSWDHYTITTGNVGNIFCHGLGDRLHDEVIRIKYEVNSDPWLHHKKKESKLLKSSIEMCFVLYFHIQYKTCKKYYLRTTTLN